MNQSPDLRMEVCHFITFHHHHTTANITFRSHQLLFAHNWHHKTAVAAAYAFGIQFHAMAKLNKTTTKRFYRTDSLELFFLTLFRHNRLFAMTGIYVSSRIQVANIRHFFLMLREKKTLYILEGGADRKLT